MAISIGDVFEDKDARRKGRRVTVRFIEDDYATVEDSKGSTTDVKLKRLEKRFRKVVESGDLTADDLQNAPLTDPEDDDEQPLSPAQQGVVDATMARLGYVRLPSSEVLLERTLEALKTGEHTVTGVEDLAKVIISQI